MSDKILIIKQIRSDIGRLRSHKACLKGLGIRKMHQAVRILATSANLGMINKIAYMLKVEEV
nr:50S ribosomal protein L30 [Methylomagnum ishizawai]